MLPDTEWRTTVLYTIGYQGLQLDDFIRILKQHGVNAIIDVRNIPHSRKRGFSKKHLIALAAANDMEYFSLKALGSPAPIRQKLREAGDYEEFFEAYEKHMKQQKAVLEDAAAMAQNGICCLLCYERDASLCHRKIVASEIATLDHGMEVVHL